MESVRIHCFQ